MAELGKQKPKCWWRRKQQASQICLDAWKASGRRVARALREQEWAGNGRSSVNVVRATLPVPLQIPFPLAEKEKLPFQRN